MFKLGYNMIAGTCGLMANHWASHTTKGKIWLAMGILALIVDAKLCYEYGVTQTVWHGIGFAVVALFFSQLPDGAYEEYQKGNKAAAVILGILCIPLGAVAYQSHIGFGAGVRMGDMKKAMLQQTRYDDGRENVADAKRNNDLWTKQLAELNEKNRWVASVKADALRAELATFGARIEEEKKGKRGRAAGCGKECERLQDEAKAVAARIATSEQAEDLTKRIEATQRLISAYREKSEKTEAGVSSVANQTEANAQLFGVLRAAWTGEPLEAAMKTTEQSAKLTNLAITAAGSLAFMLMAPVGFFMSGRNRRKERDEDQASPRAAGPFAVTLNSKSDDMIKALKRVIEDAARESKAA